MRDDINAVLVVDDDDEWNETLADFLKEEGYSVTVAPNGTAALQKLSQMRPMAIVTDLEMPVLDGRQLLGRVQARDPLVPVIVVTGARGADADPSLAGAFRIIHKPVAVETLLQALVAARADC